jgi:hypothetical protein
MQDRPDADPGDLAETSDVGDWKVPDFKTACSYAVSQGWLIVADDALTLTTAGLGRADDKRRGGNAGAGGRLMAGSSTAGPGFEPTEPTVFDRRSDPRSRK